jgi:hypothetical protein
VSRKTKTFLKNTIFKPAGFLGGGGGGIWSRFKNVSLG